jgi:hypothetical protein
MTEKRKFNPLFLTLIMGAGGRPTYFKMVKNVKILIIFARDGLRWSCLGVTVQNLKFFQTLAVNLSEIDIFQSINQKFFVSQNVQILQGGCAGDWARIKKLF